MEDTQVLIFCPPLIFPSSIVFLSTVNSVKSIKNLILKSWYQPQSSCSVMSSVSLSEDYTRWLWVLLGVLGGGREGKSLGMFPSFAVFSSASFPNKCDYLAEQRLMATTRESPKCLNFAWISNTFKICQFSSYFLTILSPHPVCYSCSSVKY